MERTAQVGRDHVHRLNQMYQKNNELLKWIKALTVAFSLITLIITLIKKFLNRHKYKELKISNVDEMSGLEFENYLKQVLTHQGYLVEKTPVSGDLGVDLIAERGHSRLAIQVKRYQGKVSRTAVSDAVAGMNYYRCNGSMVITNSFFSPGAMSLAKASQCILIDREILSNWIYQISIGSPPRTEKPINTKKGQRP
jgi:restriction system protein